jgi:hypothetical protein
MHKMKEMLRLHFEMRLSYREISRGFSRIHMGSPQPSPACREPARVHRNPR